MADHYGDPIEYVKGWLTRQGYHLEYEVARRIHAESDLEVEQGRYWRDTEPLSGRRKGRELDVVAAHRGRADDRAARHRVQVRNPTIGSSSNARARARSVSRTRSNA